MCTLFHDSCTLHFECFKDGASGVLAAEFVLALQWFFQMVFDQPSGNLINV